MRVAVGLSGGVDSAVAAGLLLREGYEVCGVSMQIWDGRTLPTEESKHACYGPGEPGDIEDAAAVAKTLGIPFHVVKLQDEYNKNILELCTSEYCAGRTPNPCVHCNRLLKFELIPRKLAEMGVGLDAFSTGHYVRVEHDEANARYLLKKGIDPEKEQSYFLYQLRQEELKRTIFPLGNYTKTEVRKLAKEFSLPVAEKSESQNFITGGYEILFGNKENPGPIVDSSGKKLGEHRGIHHFTVGQRRGLQISHPEPLYVISIEPSTNSVIVGPEKELYQKRLIAEAMNWIAVPSLTEPMSLKARIRYRHKETPARVVPVSESCVEVEFAEPQRAITPGQALVLYKEDVVFGGGIIAAHCSGN